MAVTKLKTYSEIAAAELAERSYTTLKQVMTDLDKISESIDDNISLLENYQKRISAASNFVIDLSTPNLHKSPVGKSSFKPSLVKDLDKNFAIVKNLWAQKTTLGTLEAQVRMAKNLGQDMSTALNGISQLRKKLIKALTQSGRFLQDQADKNMPEEFITVVRNIQRLVGRCLAYGDTTTFSYLFPDGDSLCFCSYIELKDVIDDKGIRVPELYVVVSFTIAAGLMGKKTYYMDIMHEFEPPSNALFTAQINPGKMASVAEELSDLLRVSQFANSIKQIPVKLLLDPASLKPELFSFSEYIDAVGTNEQGLVFYLKPTVIDKAIMDKIQSQLYLDAKALITNTRARMSPHINMKDVYNGAKCASITYRILRGKDAPAASEDDLEFLKERFNISDGALKKILVTINKD